MPRKKVGSRKKQCNFRLDPDTSKELTKLAKKNGVSKAVMLTCLIATEAAKSL